MKKKKVEYSTDVKKLHQQLEEHFKLSHLAQKMLMIQVLKFIRDKEYTKLKQFCETYMRD